MSPFIKWAQSRLRLAFIVALSAMMISTTWVPATAADNQPPVAPDVILQATSGVLLNHQLEGSDPDGDPLRYFLVTHPSHGFAHISESGLLDYTSQEEFEGSDSMTYQVEDGTVTTEGTITFEVVSTRYEPLEAFGYGGASRSRVRFYNPNNKAVTVKWGSASQPTANTVTVGAYSNVTPYTTLKWVHWSAFRPDGTVINGGSVMTLQYRPTGRIAFACKGSRRLVKLYMNNRASTVPVWYRNRVGGANPVYKVPAGRLRVAAFKTRGMRPGTLVVLRYDRYGGSGTVVVDRARVPRRCTR